MRIIKASVPLKLRIKLECTPTKKSKINSYISFVSGTLLIISETMPFIDNKYNGIIDTFVKIQQEYKQDFN